MGQQNDPRIQSELGPEQQPIGGRQNDGRGRVDLILSLELEKIQHPQEVIHRRRRLAGLRLLDRGDKAEQEIAPEFRWRVRPQERQRRKCLQ